MTSDNPMIETNDPRLTDYVLGELAPSEVAQIEAALKSSPELRAAVADIRAATETIASVFQTEPSLQLSPKQKAELLAEAESANTDVHSFADNVTPTVAGEHYRPSSGSTAHWIKIAVAASLAGLLLGGAYYFTKTDRLPMAASESPVHDSVVELEGLASEELSAGDDQEEEDQMRELKPDRVDTFSDRSNPVAPEDMLPTEESDLKEVRPGGAGLMWKKGGVRMQPSLAPKAAQKSNMPTAPRNKRSPASKAPLSKEFLAKDKSVASENEKSNSRMLLRAQQSLDQSTLGSLNLKVVAQNTPNQSYKFRGDLFDDARENQPAKIANRPAKNGTLNGPIPSSPATFKLQISDQTAKQIVQLLANQTDPLQQRKLSFNELIGLQQSQSAEGTVAEKDHGGDNPSLKFGTGSTAHKADRGREQSLEASPENLQDAAALVLASKLRKHVGQPAYQNTEQATKGLNDIVKNSRLGGIAGSKILPAPQESADDDPLKAPADFTKPNFDATNRILRSRPNEFDFDYSMVIQQLKLNLEIRNQSVNLKPNDAPARKVP